jgi:hypothetical protein
MPVRIEPLLAIRAPKGSDPIHAATSLTQGVSVLFQVAASGIAPTFWPLPDEQIVFCLTST